jgi:hypothetical protein
MNTEGVGESAPAPRMPTRADAFRYWLRHRKWGGFVAGGLFVLPSLFILIALSWVYMAFGNV